MCKLLSWQRSGCTVITCGYEIKIWNLSPEGALQEAQQKDNVLEPFQYLLRPQMSRAGTSA